MSTVTTTSTSDGFSLLSGTRFRDEGEGDLSLAYWRKEHEAYFRREGTFSEDMEVYCMRFRVVEVLPDQ
jgi:uncharacterized protein YhfF